MIFTVLGAVLMLSGIAMVVRQTAQNWTSLREALSRRPKDKNAKVSYSGVVILGIGVVLVLIGTSGSPPPPPSP
jgi:uncharacterized membrane protein